MRLLITVILIGLTIIALFVPIIKVQTGGCVPRDMGKREALLCFDGLRKVSILEYLKNYKTFSKSRL